MNSVRHEITNGVARSIWDAHKEELSFKVDALIVESLRNHMLSGSFNLYTYYNVMIDTIDSIIARETKMKVLEI